MITFATHPGRHGAENQDDCFIYEHDVIAAQCAAFAVFDGHGPGGTTAAAAAKLSMLNSIEDLDITTFKLDPEGGMCAIFEAAQTSVTEALGDDIGGTTASLVIKIEETLYSAHVGDSLIFIETPTELIQVCAGDASHSPENPSEYKRIQGVAPKTKFLYDKLTGPPTTDIFDDEGNVTNLGHYYCNVNENWAALIQGKCAKKKHQLAFTRSLGDIIPGVSHVPHVQTYPLLGGTTVTLATDGIWDNWKITKAALQELWETTAEQAIAKNEARAVANFGASRDNATIIIVHY
jgi:serine/threonine protein phosphatase PrpC